MNKLNKIKLTNLTSERLSENQMKQIKGGTQCTCSCSAQGGSSSTDNCSANIYIGSGGHSTGGDNGYLCVTN